MYELLILILIANILQIPQIQKLISWSWVELRWINRKSFRFILKWTRRAYYGVFG